MLLKHNVITFYSRNEFLANAVAQFQGQNLQKKKKIAQEIEFLRREQLLPINISTLCLFKRLFIRALG